MDAQTFLNRYQGQSLLYNKADPSLTGQCVQSVAYYVVANGKPVMSLNAADWWYSGQYPEHYERIPNSSSAVPQAGDIIIWDRNLPNSAGAGHIAVCLYSRPGTGTFVSVDQNWGGKTVHQVTHNYNNVVGWLRIRRPAPAPQTQGDEMIANADQATKIYKMLRPNGGASQNEIDGTAGHRTFAEFVNSAQAEVNARDGNLRDQASRLDEMSRTINTQNQTITDLTTKLKDADTSASDKQKALSEALDKLASQNADIANKHDEVVDLQNQVAVVGEPPQKPNLLIRFLSIFVKK